MEHLHEVRLHPGPFPGSQNNGYDAFQAPILFERNFLFYTTFNAFSSTHYKIFSSPRFRVATTCGGDSPC
jgi:hypothetical protein